MRRTREKIDYNLRFMAEVLGADYLHWGYFPERKFRNAALPWAELKQAQEDYTTHLLSFVPESVRTILDAGCGLGKTAHLLQTRGYVVHCLSSDPYQQTVVAERYPDLPFTRSRFEEAELNQGFDLILMSESSQYMDWIKALARIKKTLNPGGYLLLSDYFRYADDPYYRTCKVKGVFDEMTASAGLTLVRAEDITEFVLPTLDFGRYYYRRYVLPSANILLEMAGDRAGPLARGLIRLFFRKHLAKAWYYVFEKMPRKFDRDLFQQKMCYMIQLWRLAS